MHAMLWVGLRSLRWWGCSRQLHWFTWTTTEDLSNQTIDQKWSEAVCVRVGFKNLSNSHSFRSLRLRIFLRSFTKQLYGTVMIQDLLDQATLLPQSRYLNLGRLSFRKWSWSHGDIAATKDWKEGEGHELSPRCDHVCLMKIDKVILIELWEIVFWKPRVLCQESNYYT